MVLNLRLFNLSRVGVGVVQILVIELSLGGTQLSQQSLDVVLGNLAYFLRLLLNAESRYLQQGCG